MIIKFITTLAWILGCLSSVFVLMRIIGYFTYTEFDRLKDNLRGQEATFPVVRPALLAIVCWVWIAST